MKFMMIFFRWDAVISNTSKLIYTLINTVPKRLRNNTHKKEKTIGSSCQSCIVHIQTQAKELGFLKRILHLLYKLQKASLSQFNDNFH